MLNKLLEEAYSNCFLLKFDIIKNELTKLLKDYALINSDQKYFDFINHKREKISLEIGFNYINITKVNNYQAERIWIDENFVILEKSLEKRENGVVLKDISKKLACSNRFKNELVITDILENTYIFTKEKLESLMSCLNYKEASPISLFDGLRLFETREDIDFKELSDYNTEFKTGMNYYYKNLLNSSRSYKESPYSTMTYLNGEDVSLIYDLIDGSDKISRIYDLYSGIITPQNEDDIKAISLGLLRNSVYDLKSISGIREKEDNLVGKTLIKLEDNYLNYVKEFILTNYNSKYLDRETVIRIITLVKDMNFKKEELDLNFDIPNEIIKTNQVKEENKFMKILKKTFKSF